MRPFVRGLICWMILAVGPVTAGDKSTGFLPRVFKGKEGDSKYVVFVPHDYKGDKEYPLILFLHGAGERGDDGDAPVKQGVGSGIKFKGQEDKFKFIVVFPQCAAGKEHNWKAGGPDADRALAILDEVMKIYKVDAKRLYLTGLSMGGAGTWSLAAAHPQKWAAIAPICGKAEVDIVDKIKHIPCWVFVGDQDRKDLVESSREMVSALKKAGAAPRFTEFPHVGHNSWDPAYVMGEFYSWLLAQQLK